MSKEGVLVLGTFKVESPGIGESGPVTMSGRQGPDGFESLTVNAFGKNFILTKPQLDEMKGGYVNGLQFTYERGYTRLGGRTLYLQFFQGFSSGVVESKSVTLKESGGITIATEETP
jgi:hypothetical protein